MTPHTSENTPRGNRNHSLLTNDMDKNRRRCRRDLNGIGGNGSSTLERSSTNTSSGQKMNDTGWVRNWMLTDRVAEKRCDYSTCEEERIGKLLHHIFSVDIVHSW